MIMYYEDFVSDPKTYMKQFLDFVDAPNDWENIDVEEHRELSVKLYETGGSEKVGSQTKGALHLQKVKQILNFTKKN